MPTALGTNGDIRKPELRLSFQDLPKSPGHPFYEALQEILGMGGFDAFCERICSPFYSDEGRPSIPPGTYFRMLMIGFFEGIDASTKEANTAMRSIVRNISKLKDGRTKLAYKPEHSVDLDTQAVITVEIHPANRGDTTTGPKTLAKGCENLIAGGEHPCKQRTCVADKGYFKSEHLGDLHGTSMCLDLAELNSPKEVAGSNDRRAPSEA